MGRHRHLSSVAHMAFFHACTSVETMHEDFRQEAGPSGIDGPAVLAFANLPFTSMPDGSSHPKPPPMSSASDYSNAHNVSTTLVSGAHRLAGALIPPASGKLLRAQVLLKKELEYPYAWKPHKAYLYDDGTLIFIERAPEKAASHDADLSGTPRSCYPSWRIGKTIRVSGLIALCSVGT